jgi:hypothetical protein
MFKPFFCRTPITPEHASPNATHEILTKNGMLEIKNVA